MTFKPVSGINPIVCELIHAMGFSHVKRMVLTIDMDEVVTAEVTSVVTEDQVRETVTKLYEFDIRSREVNSGNQCDGTLPEVPPRDVQ